MDMTNPVYTIENECQDCYKCIRHCRCKAIKIVNGKASVIPGACVACGECVKVCPAHAKKIRSDLARLRQMLNNGEKIYASIAPSFVGYFKNVSIGQLANALMKAGFTGVSETAHGAEAVSARNCELLKDSKLPLMISSACPATVDYILKYRPEYAKYISPVQSPLMSHCRQLREAYGDDIKVVFFGPCAAKKNEADRNADVLNLALVFPVLEQLLAEKGITITSETAPLALGEASEGRFYSVEGGMNDTLRSEGLDVRFIAVSGLENFSRMISGCTEMNPGRPVFIEALACHGGCVNGPAMPVKKSMLEIIMATDRSSPVRSSADRPSGEQPVLDFAPAPVKGEAPDERAIARALARVGKLSKADEINCGACGYNTCRDFAKALLLDKAEEAMCHNYLRKNFERTSNALIRYIPAAVVIVDDKLNIAECNRNFAVLVDADDVYQSLGNLNTIPISSYLPDYEELFVSVIENGGEIEKYHQPYGEKIIDISVFSIAQGKVAGAVISDVTRNEFQREQVAAKARQVIRQNVLTVQQVARLFGEHIAETEIMLNEIAGTYEAHSGEHHEG